MIRAHRHFAVIGLLLLSHLSCGTKNLGEAYDEKTEAENAKIALEAGDFDSAIEHYEAAIEADPEAYEHYPLLAVAYAAKAGVLLSETLKSQISGKSESGSASAGLGSQVQQVMPTNPTKDQIAALDKAVAVLRSMPSEHRVDGGDYPYASGAAFQFSLFQTMYSLMILQQFQSVESGGAPSKEKLESMTDAEATAALQSLEAAITNAPDTESGKALRTIGSGKLEEIKASPGATDKEKIQAYIQADAAKKAAASGGS